MLLLSLVRLSADIESVVTFLTELKTRLLHYQGLLVDTYGGMLKLTMGNLVGEIIWFCYRMSRS